MRGILYCTYNLKGEESHFAQSCHLPFLIVVILLLIIFFPMLRKHTLSPPPPPTLFLSALSKSPFNIINRLVFLWLKQRRKTYSRIQSNVQLHVIQALRLQSTSQLFIYCSVLCLHAFLFLHTNTSASSSFSSSR